MLEDYSDQDTVHTGKPRLYIFAMNEFLLVMLLAPCGWEWMFAHMLYILFFLFNQHQGWTNTSKELPLLEVEYS